MSKLPALRGSALPTLSPNKDGPSTAELETLAEAGNKQPLRQKEARNGVYAILEAAGEAKTLLRRKDADPIVPVRKQPPGERQLQEVSRSTQFAARRRQKEKGAVYN